MRPGIRQLQCEECGRVIEVETGIKTMYCHAKMMVEVDLPPEQSQPPADEKPRSLKFRPSR